MGNFFLTYAHPGCNVYNMNHKEKKRTTVFINQKLRRELSHVLIDLNISFSEWVEDQMRETVAASKWNKESTQIDMPTTDDERKAAMERIE